MRLIATATALVVAGGVISSDRDAALASADAVLPAAPAALAGVYRTEVFGSRGRFDGELYPGPDSTRWFAIRSTCSAAGCTADGTPVDDPGRRAATGGGSAFHLSFERGHWIGEPVADVAPCLADPRRDVALSVGWRLTPRPDGTLTGTRTLTESTGGAAGACAGSGGVYEVPVELTPVPSAGPIT